MSDVEAAGIHSRSNSSTGYGPNQIGGFDVSRLAQTIISAVGGKFKPSSGATNVIGSTFLLFAEKFLNACSLLGIREYFDGEVPSDNVVIYVSTSRKMFALLMTVLDDSIIHVIRPFSESFAPDCKAPARFAWTALKNEYIRQDSSTKLHVLKSFIDLCALKFVHTNDMDKLDQHIEQFIDLNQMVKLTQAEVPESIIVLSLVNTFDRDKFSRTIQEISTSDGGNPCGLYEAKIKLKEAFRILQVSTLFTSGS